MKFFLIFLLSFSFFIYAESPEERLSQLTGFSYHPVYKIRELRTLSKEFEIRHPFTPSPVEIDIFIPTLEKELPVLEHAVSYARRYIMHPIHTIYIVAPDSALLKDFCSKANCIFVDENTVLPIQMKDIDYFPQGIDRRGWIFQQLLKLAADRVCESQHILILDSDTLLVRPQSFIYQNQTILECSDERNYPYYLHYVKLLNEPLQAPFSFVCHHMLFEKTKLRDLKNRIEHLHGIPWHQAILQFLDKNELSSFSEYETYGNFFVSHYPGEFIQLYYFNVHTTRDNLSALINKNLYPPKSFGLFTKSISFHDWLN